MPAGCRRSRGVFRCFGCFILFECRLLTIECFGISSFYPVWRDKACHGGDKACHTSRKFDPPEKLRRAGPPSSESGKLKFGKQNGECHAEGAETRRRARAD